MESDRARLLSCCDGEHCVLTPSYLSVLTYKVECQPSYKVVHRLNKRISIKVAFKYRAKVNMHWCITALSNDKFMLTDAVNYRF